jgi:hypothetical protein
VLGARPAQPALSAGVITSGGPNDVQRRFTICSFHPAFAATTTSAAIVAH